MVFLSLRAWLKKSVKNTQRLELKSRGMVHTQQEKSSEPLRINSANYGCPLFKQKCHAITEGLSLKGENDSTLDNDTNVVTYVKDHLVPSEFEYQVPSEVDVHHIKGNDKVVCLEVPRRGGEINNQAIHAIETSIKNIDLKIAKLSWEMKFVKSELNKK